MDPVPALTSKLKNQCVRLNIPMSVIRTGEPGRDDLFISPHGFSEEAKVGELSAGTELYIEEVVHRRSFEGSTVRVIGRVKSGGSQELDLSGAFDIEWLVEVSQRLNYDRKAELPTLEKALDKESAEWCESVPSRSAV